MNERILSISTIMKTLLYLSLSLSALLIYDNKSFSLTNSQIKKFCKKEKSQSTCIKNFKEKRLNLQEGKLIEIPVIPFKRDRN